MIELLGKASEAIKISHGFFLLIGSFLVSPKLFLRKEEIVQDDVPGDNFPFIVMRRDRFK